MAGTVQRRDCEWSVTIFAREARRVLPCLEGTAAALAGHAAEVSVLLIGAGDVDEGALTVIADRIGARLQVCAIPFPCRANAWNHFVHALRPRAELHFCVDARVTPEPAAFAELARALHEAPAANAAAATAPSPGRRGMSSVREALPGPLCAMRDAFLQRLVVRGLRLPIGLQGADGLIASFILHDLDAIGQPRAASRLVLCETARWRAEPFFLLRWPDWRRLLFRSIRRARETLEDAAIREITSKAGFEGLPQFAEPMLLDWVTRYHQPGRGLSLTEALVRHGCRGRCRRMPPAQVLEPRCTCPGGWRAAVRPSRGSAVG
jgi:hypothetical protein